MLDQITGTPCANCESAPASRGPFCSNGCRDEYEGTGAYAEPASLFTRTELVQAEALRQHKAAQVPGQLDIWDACAEVAAEVPSPNTTGDTMRPGDAVTYFGSIWVVPVEGIVVRVVGERLTLRVRCPDEDRWVTLRNVRRSSVTSLGAAPAPEPFAWPELEGALFDAVELRGQQVLA